MFKEFKKLLSIHILVIVIVMVFFEPLLHLCWEVLKDISGLTFSFLLDNIYRNAALGQRNWLDYVLISGFSIIIMTSFITMIVINVRNCKRYKLLKKLKGRSPEEREKILDEKKRKSVQTSIQPSFQKYVNKIVIYSLSVFFLLFFITSAHFDLQLNTSFNQRMNALAPYITDQDSKVLKAEWAQMKSRQDFLKLSSQMDAMARKNNIKLPALLLK